MKKTSIFSKAICLALFGSLNLNAEAQVIFRDDFSRSTLGSAWVPSESSKWSIVNGEAYNFYDGVGAVLMSAKKFTQRNYVIETIAFPLKSGYHRQYSILFGKPDPKQDYGYVLKYNPYYNQGLTLGRAEGNDYWPVVLAQKTITLDPAKSHTFKIEHYPNGQIKVFVNSGNGYDSQPVLQATDNTYTTLGHLGWRVDTETSAEPFSVDWMEVRVLPSLLTSPKTISGTNYQVANLGAGVPLYADRAYTITSLPANLRQAAFIQTANANKTDARSNFLNFNLAQQSTVYVFYDPRATVLPSWLQGWKKLSDRIYTNDTGTSYLNIYTKEYPAGNITLGGNLASPAKGSLTNYVVAAVPGTGNLLAREGVSSKELTTKELAGEAGDEQSVLSNYPNPAHSQTTIRYYLPESSFVKLTIFDKQGRPLSILANEYQAAGMHRQSVNVQDFNSGAYIYQLQTGLQNKTGKLLISR